MLLCCTLIYCLYHYNQEEKSIIEERITITAKIIDYKWNKETKRIEISAKSKNEKYLLIYFYEEEKESDLRKIIQYGNQIKVIGTKKNPSNNTIPNAFNYKKYLKSVGFSYYIQVSKIEKEKSGNLFSKFHQKIRNRIECRENSYYFKTLLLGIKEKSENKMEEIYQINGINHIFVISGMHLGLCYACFKKLTKKLWKNEKIQVIISFLLLSFYYSLLSKSISSSRVFYFFGLLSINQILHLKLKNIQIYILTLCIHLLMNPFCIYHISFQYSFLLSFFYLILKKKEKTKIRQLVKNILLSFFVTLPITIYYSYTINPWSMLINLWMIPFVTFLLFPGLCICFLFSFLTPILTILIYWMENLNIFFSKLPMFLVPKITESLLFLYYIFLYFIMKKKKWKNVILLICILIISFFLPKLDPNAHFYFLDVGQGDSTLIVLPHQKEVILIDTGKENEFIKNNLISLLKSLGIKKIDYLILSHGDSDHVGNANNLLKEYKVENVIFNMGGFNDLEIKLMKILEQKNIKYYKGLKELSVDKYKFQFLNTKTYNNENDNSNVIYFNYNNYKFLFMGDATSEKEKDILDKYNLKNIDFLKVGHHGSDTSSSEYFIDQINPKYSLISAGKNNRYGHPKKSVLEILKSSHIYRTDLDGSVEIKLNKRGYMIRTCPP